MEGLKAQSEQHEEFLQGIQDRISTKLEGKRTSTTRFRRASSTFTRSTARCTPSTRPSTRIYDICAVRHLSIPWRTATTCSATSTTCTKPIPGRFKDYISTPKPNGYQSLHTTVIGRAGIPFEVQIRTVEMHKMAEYGVAAHWKYKQGLDKKGNEEAFAWIRQLLEAQQDTEAEDFIKTSRLTCSRTRYSSLRPRAMWSICRQVQRRSTLRMRFTPQSATRTTGCKLNGRIAPIDSQLKTAISLRS